MLQLRQSGQITDDTLLWRDGLTGWLPLRELSGELGPAATPGDTPDPPTPPASTPVDEDRWTLAPVEPRADAAAAGDAADSGWRPVSEGVGAPIPGALASPYAPPTAPVAMPNAVVQGGEVIMAGFRKRLAAYLIDGLITGLAVTVVGAIIGGLIGGLMYVGGAGGDTSLGVIELVANLMSIVLTAGYYAWFHASHAMATPGKMAVGIKVVRLNGERISIARGVGRYFATILSALPLLIGFLMAAFTARKQALHDMVCDTLVVDKWAFTSQPELQRRELGTVTVVVLVVFGVLLVLGLLLILAIAGIAAFA